MTSKIWEWKGLFKEDKVLFWKMNVLCKIHIKGFGFNTFRAKMIKSQKKKKKISCSCVFFPKEWKFSLLIDFFLPLRLYLLNLLRRTHQYLQDFLNNGFQLLRQKRQVLNEHKKYPLQTQQLLCILT